MELFKSKKIGKEKSDSNNNWKTALIQTISFYPKDVCLFSVFFIWMKVSCQVCLIKYLENEISNSTSHKK